MNREEEITAWARYVDGLRLRHFSGAELARYCNRTRNGVLNSPPPRDLWPALVPTLQLADLARVALGVPLTLTSAFRSPAYNAQVGGASASLHLRNNALDLSPVGDTAGHLHGLFYAWRKAGVFKGGLGLYPSFVHVDTRGDLFGMASASWTG